MKKFLYTFLFFFLLSCQNSELIQRDYPILLTLNIKEITSSLITVSAEVIKRDSRIIEHGFIWGFASISMPVDTILLGPLEDTEQIFQYSFNNTFFDNKGYYVIAFVKTSTFSVYGNPINFKCKLCGPATQATHAIYSFAPASTREGRSVKIQGINLNIGNPEVLYGNSTCQINAINDVEISITIPKRERFGSRTQKLYLQQKNVLGTRKESTSFLVLNEPWLWLNQDRILPSTAGQYVFSHGNRMYFRNGRSLSYIDYEAMETKNVSGVPELYNFIRWSVKYNNKWYVVFLNGAIGVLNYFWEYDILNDSWRRLPDLPTNGNYSVAFASNNTLFLSNPFNESENLKFNLSDFTSGTHQISMKIFTNAPRFIQTQNSVYAISGNQLAVLKSDTETWEILKEEVIPNDYIYVIRDDIYFGNYVKLLQYSINDDLLIDRTNQVTSFPLYNFGSIDYRINLESKGLIQFSQGQASAIWEFDPTYFEK